MDPSTNRLMMGSATVGGPADNWIATLNGASSEVGRGVAVNGTGDIFISGADGNRLFLARYDSFGTLIWQRQLSGPSGTENGGYLVIDGSSNCYVSGSTTFTGDSTEDTIIAKYDSSGNLQWQRIIGTTFPTTNAGIAIDSSNNVLVCGNTRTGSSTWKIFTAKYNSSGVLQWQRFLDVPSNGTTSSSIAVDSSGSPYIVGITQDAGAGSADGYIAKLNSSGTFQWQRTLGNAGYGAFVGVTVDSSNNIYACGYADLAGTFASFTAIVAKYNTSGSLIWQRSLASSSFTNFFITPTTDSSGNIYLTGRTTAPGVTGSEDLLVAKYNSSGSLQWHRYLGATTADGGEAATVDNTGNVYVAGYTNDGGGLAGVISAKLPDDGSLTGTYGAFTYKAGSMTAGTPTLTSGTPSFSNSSGSMTAATSALTSSASSLTSTLIPM